MSTTPLSRYIYITRESRDVFWSLWNHWSNANDEWYGAVNSVNLMGPPCPKPEGSARDDFLKWLTTAPPNIPGRLATSQQA